MTDSRQIRIRSQVGDLLAQLLGLDEQEIDAEASFLELGADSLLLLQASQSIQAEFGVKVAFRRLLDEISTPAALAAHLDQEMPAEEVPAYLPAEDAALAEDAAPAEETADFPAASLRQPSIPAPEEEEAFFSEAEAPAALEAIIERQIQIMNRQLEVTAEQLELLGQQQDAEDQPAAPAAIRPAVAPSPPPDAGERRPAAARSRRPEPAPYVPYRPAQKGTSDLTPRQQQHLEALIARLGRRTRESKRRAQEDRPVLADNRATAGFRPLFKELLYNILVERAAGARVWDVDGNEYVDVTMGFGTLVFGHSPAFVLEALREQTERGLGIGLESPVAGKAAQLLCELTGNERATFVNSGTEAVMAAIRLARVKTGRTRIAIFRGGFHGFFDEVMAIPGRPRDGRPRSVPMAPGVPPHVSESVMVLEYCRPESIEILEGSAHELAAVLVEPQQTRRPGSFDTKEFLHQLRRVTEAAGAALILDEVVTGFRLHPGGAQAVYEVRADLVTYGKAVGAGLPVGVVAGKAAFMDGLDGGMWSYGDDSHPQAESTFLSGTYFRHPLIMPAVRAVLNHYQSSGPRLQEELLQRTTQLAERLNDTFEHEQVPIRALYAGSICHFSFQSEVKYPSLFYYHLLDNGLYVRDGRPWFLSTAHTAEDVEQIIGAVEASVEAMREGGFLPASPERPERNVAPEPRILRATEAQQELWLLAQLGEDASRAYNEGYKIRLRGPLRPAALHHAVREVVDRHEALRAAFGPQGDELRIAPRSEVEIPLCDLSHLKEDPRKQREVDRLLADEANRTFDLHRMPLFRLRVVKRQEDDHLLAATFHHSIADGLSNGIVLSEIAACYGAACRGRRCRLPEPTSIGEFARWQNSWLESPESAEAEAFWRGQFADAVPVLELPADRPRPPVKTYAGSSELMTIGAPLAEALRKMGTAHGSTTFVTLVAGVQLLLHRLAGQDDVVVCTAAAGQAVMGERRLVGHCVNLLPLRSRIHGDPGLPEQLAAVRQTVVGAFEHQNYPFNRLLKLLKLPMDPSRTPLLAAAMNLDRTSSGDLGFFELDAEIATNPSNAAKFELFLDIAESDTGLEVRCIYNTDLFDQQTIRRWLGHLRTQLEGMAHRPAGRLSELPLLAPAERHQVLLEWNDTRAEYRQDRCIHELFETRVTRAPDAVAVVAGTRQLSYGELNRRSNQLAHHLRKKGVGQDVVVGIHLQRSLKMVEGILGVLKAGGTYLPLEPSYPRERIAFMLSDSQASVLLTEPALAAQLPPHDSRLVCLSDDREAMARECDDDPDRRAHPENLAYVIYTSGSTGKPKGVALSHRGLVNLVTWHWDAYDVTPADRATQIAQTAFDASVWELWPYLTAGGRLYIVDEETRSSPGSLANWLVRNRITISFVSTLFAEAFLDQAWPENLALRNLLTGGDALRRWPRRELPFALVNNYGPTENTVVTTWTALSADRGSDMPPPIGRALSNMRVHILDRSMKPAPAGTPGELYVGGPGLARGYLDRPGLTAERFVPDPFLQGERLYRSGDLVRYLGDGNLEFLGRLDDQVKVRGFRIELGEIESVLREHPAVAEAVVTARQPEGGPARLAAYVVAEASGQGLTEELGGYLRQRLPEYMVPSFFVPLERLPVTPTGKIDRSALPEPDGSRPELSKAYVAPGNDLERTLARIWSEVLGLDKVGVHDNFFDLGGHSLLMAQVHGKLQETLDWKLSMLDLFQYPTIGSLAVELGRSESRPPSYAQSRARAAAREEVLSQPGHDRQAAGGTAEIAVIGMTGRFPGASDLDAFWRNLRQGVESVTPFSDEELLAAGVPPKFLEDPNFVKAGAALEGTDLFDAAFFGINPREAQVTNPQHRFFLECAWEAVESAGYAPESYPGTVGVFGGASNNAYESVVMSNPEVAAATGGRLIGVGNWNDHLTTRVSYKLNLKGPSYNVQTACSTSLVAVHLACQSLRSGQCDMALAGGVTIGLAQQTGYLTSTQGLNSPDGHVRAFDAEARGTVFASGCGVVVLKRLADAQRDGDPIRAVVRGSAINNDGSGKVGYLAPSVEGQAEAIVEAQSSAGINPETISYVETHGTGTSLGDPIEIRALNQAFRAATERKGFCAIGSLKTNVGHLDCAAGVAGLIKTVLALEHRELPPSLNFATPNPEIDFPASPFYVNTELREWSSNGAPRRAGISAFGVGGTNAHVVLEEAPPAEPSQPPPPGSRQVLVLSAKTPSALERASDQLATHLRTHPELNLADVAYTLQSGREAFSHRRFVVSQSPAEAREALEGRDPQRVFTAFEQTRDRPCAFMFPGLGHHHVNMSRGLYDSVPAFRKRMDACCELVAPHLELDLRRILYPPAAETEEAERILSRMPFAHAAQFAVEHSLATLWMEWGIQPRAMIGHSLGEYVVACLAGVLSLEDALGLVVTRGRLIERQADGTMLVVALPEQELVPLLGSEVSLALVNAPSLCVVSGSRERIDEFAAGLAERQVECRRVHITIAAHSHLMEPMLDAYAEEVAKIELHPPRLPYISNLSETWITPEQATDPGYWVRHLRRTVRFSQGLRTLLGELEDPALLEVGPGNTLGTLARQHPEAAGLAVVSSLRHPKEQTADTAVLGHALGKLWLAGVEVDWCGLHAGTRRCRLPLPTYPFERRRFWIEPQPGTASVLSGLGPPAEIADEPAPLAAEVGTACQRPGLSSAFVAARSEIERKIAGVWQTLLGHRQVGLHDDFFELGGHSLIAIRIISRLREHFGIELPLADFFDPPTVAGVAEKTAAALGREKPTELDRVRPPIVPRDQEGPVPLSFAQQRLWFLDRLMPDNPFYNIDAAWTLSGRLNLPALRRSLDEIVRRHEALRTRFAAHEGQPLQMISPPEEQLLKVVDLTALGREDRQAETNRLSGEEALRPFDLTRGPVLRATLLEQDGQQHALLITMHHIVSDGWSFGVFFRELTSLYKAFAAGNPSPLPELAVQYADFAVWQRQWLTGEVLAEQLSYWERRLRGAPFLELPTDRPRPAEQAFRGRNLPVRFPAELSQELSSLSQRHGVTLYMTLLAAFQTLLHRYSAQRDILVGSATANRNHGATEALIGLFVNSLVMRSDLAGDTPFVEFLAEVGETALQAYAHQDLPFEKLVEKLQPERNLNRNPIFQVTFALQALANEEFDMPGLTVRGVPMEAHTVRFDLELHLTETPAGLTGHAIYDRDLFDGTTIGRLLGHFRVLLESIAGEASQRLSDLPVLRGAERHQLLTAWNDTLDEYPAGHLFHDLFAAQAARTPDAVAVIFAQERLSYGKLDRRANQLARHLRRRGVGPEVLVGLCVSRSLEMIVGLLGILKAGGAYLPLDPSYPGERLAFMLEDSRAPVVVTRRSELGSFPEHPARVVCLDADQEAIAGESEAAPECGMSADNLAYAIYTSGSTGRPKGVLLSHQGLCNMSEAQVRTFGFGPAERILQFASLSFDAATSEITMAWRVGATLCLGTEDELLPGPSLIRRLRELEVTAMLLPPSALEVVPEAELPALRTVFVAGEASSAELVARWARVHRFFNLYGPTEGTIWTTFHRCTAGRRPPIGRPIANTRVLVLDRRRQPVPAGVPGELHIGGLDVARGYQGRPGLTAERFVPDPFGPPGSRLYRSGDLARFLADGSVEFLGRIDQQVKIRGFRIELGEIESALSRHPGVRETVVVAREDVPGRKQLAAYVTPAGKSAPTPGELRSFLQQKLPDHMVPAAFVVLAALPLTPNRKVDRRALPAPAGDARQRTATGYVAPRNPVESLLAQIWSEILRVDRVGVEDNFFELAGDSILSIRIVARAQQAGLELAPRQLFQHQTIAELAAVAGSVKRLRAEQGPVAGPVPLTPVQRWFFEQRQPDPHHANMSLVLETDPGLDPGLQEQALRHLLSHHDALRLYYVPGESGWRQVHAGPRARTPFLHLDVSALDCPEQAAAIAAAAERLQSSLELSAAPLMRAAFCDRGAGQTGRLLLVVHHLMIDGVSWRILLEDLETACAQLRRGEAVELPSKTTSFRHWAERLEAHARSGGSDSEAEHWLCDRYRTAAAVPVDVTAGANTTASLRVQTSSLSKKETRALLHQVPQAYRTQINDVLLTTLARSLKRWLGPGPVRIHLEGHGREEIFDDVDLSRTVGWFTTIFPVVLELEEDLSEGRALSSVKEQLRRIPGRGLGYGLLRYLGSDAALSARLRELPQAQVSFNYLGQFDQTPAAAPLLKMAPESAGPDHSPRNFRSHLLDVVGSVSGGQLRIQWVYSKNHHRYATVKRLIRTFQAELRALIAHCLSPEAGGFAPSDFPLARISQEKLDQCLGKDRRVADLYPLSPLQREMLMHTLAVPDSDLGLVQLCWSLKARFDSQRLKQAWQRVIARHPILRTAFLWDLDEPLQVVYQDIDELPWEEHDWRRLPPRFQQAQLAALLRADRSRRFDPARAPLYRFVLVRLGDDRYSLVWSHHHVLLDGWCKSLILREVSAFYQVLGNAEEPSPEPRRPYRDYIAWLQRQDAGEAEAFWRRTLRGFTTPTPLWIGKASPASCAANDFDERAVRLSDQSTAALRSLAQQHRLTLNTLLQGAWAMLLSRYSGEEDVAFGATVSGRPAELEGVESMVGLFINNLPVRVHPRSDALLLPWLEQLQEHQIEMRRYEYTPLAKIHEWSELRPGLPLFETMVVFENYDPSSGPQGADQEFELSDHYGTRTSSPLTLLSSPASPLALMLIYDCRRFDATAAARMLGHLRTLLEAIAAAEPGERLAELPLLTPAERHQLLVEWNGDTAIYRLDSDQEPVAIGLPGELCAGPCGDGPGTGPTKTGELARYLPDGGIERLGGTRRGVRARGRVLLPEVVEKALRQHPELGEVAVLAREDRADEPELVAYLATGGQQAPSAAELRSFLQERLPGHMIPSDFMTLEALPLDSGGEVDHRALLAAGCSRPRMEAFERDLMFQDALEAQLIQVWEEVFGVHPIRAEDNFFDLGGSSVLAVSLVTRMQERLGRDLPLAALFEGATIKDLAEQLRDRSDRMPWSPLVAIKPGGSRRPFFCVHAAGGNVLGFHDLARHLDSEQPFYGIQSVGLDGRQEPYTRVEAMAARYLEEIRTVQPHGPYLLGGLSFGGFVAFEMARQLSEQKQKVAFLALLDTWTPVVGGKPVLAELSPEDAVALAQLVGQAVAGLYGEDFSISGDELRAVAPEKRLNHALERIRRAGIVPDAGLEQTRRFLKISLSTLDAARNFVPGFYPGRITIFRAMEERVQLMELIKHPAFGDPELYEGWGALCSEPLEIHDIPGDHATMMLEPHARVLARRLTSCLHQANEEDTPSSPRVDAREPS